MKIKIINVYGKEDGIEEIKMGTISVGDLLKRLDIDVFGVIIMKNNEIVREHEMLIDSDNVTISGLGCC
jgi:sulfur carrier protein ThiS